MNIKTTLFALAVSSIGISGAMSAHAANTFSWVGSSAEADYGSLPSSGSWYNLSGYYEPMRAAGGTGTPGADGRLNFDVVHTLALGAPTDHNTGNMIDRDAKYFFGWLAHSTTGPLTIAWDGVSDTATVNMSNWRLAYSGEFTSFDATTPALLNNQDGIWGNGNDTLDYTAVTSNSQTLPGMDYTLHLVGSASLMPVPEASSYGMMLAGLGLIGFAVRRRK